jgi:trehalose 6-phosphate synthase
MHLGLIMPLDERQERWRRLFAQVQEHDVAHWRGNFVEALAETAPPAT